MRPGPFNLFDPLLDRLIAENGAPTERRASPVSCDCFVVHDLISLQLCHETAERHKIRHLDRRSFPWGGVGTLSERKANVVFEHVPDANLNLQNTMTNAPT